MTIQQICKQSGLTVDTVRYYERIGLIEAEKGAYFKDYSPEALETLLAIKKLRLAGLTLHEIKWLLSIEADPKNLSEKLIDTISAFLDNAIKNTKKCANEIAEALRLLENMKRKLGGAQNENQ